MNQIKVENEFVDNTRANRAFYLSMGILEEPDDIQNAIRDTDEYKKACRYIPCLFDERKTINKDSSSYGLKHQLERFLHKLQPSDCKGNYYMTNDAFILAMSDFGFNCQKCDVKSQNYYFNYKLCSIKSQKCYLECMLND